MKATKSVNFVKTKNSKHIFLKLVWRYGCWESDITILYWNDMAFVGIFIWAKRGVESFLVAKDINYFFEEY